MTFLTFLLAVSFAAEARPNFVFVLADDLGYADLGCQGATDIHTPNIDRLARDGVRFTDFYSNAPVCTPTRAALMTGRWQQRCGLEWAMGFTAEQQRRVDGRWVDEPDKLALGLSPSEPTLPRLLADAGYATAAFGKWHLGYRPEFQPRKHGFGQFFGTLLGHADFYRYNYFDGTRHLYDNEQPAQAQGYLTDLINQRAVAFLKEQTADKPFFLYVPYQAVHWPFQPPDRPDWVLSKENKYDGTRRDYAAMVERLDYGIGQMLFTLEEKGLADRTLFVFTSDNGGERLSNNAPLFSHKTTLWEGGIRVPCVARWPAQWPRGKEIASPSITMDWTATLLAAAGVSPRPDRPLDGTNLDGSIRGGKPADRPLCWRVDRAGRRQKAIRYGRWKFIQDDMVEMLFDLSTDISERQDLAYRQPAIVVDLKRRLAEWEADVGKNPPAFVVR